MKQFVITFSFIFVSIASYSQQDRDFAFIEDATRYIQSCFASANEGSTKLQYASLPNFQSNPFYNSLKKMAESKASLNFAKVKEYWTQYYIIDNNENHLLSVVFEKDNIKKRWKVNEWFIFQNGKEISTSDNIPLISFEENGADLLKIVNKLQIPTQNKKIDLAKHKKYSFDNIGVYQDSKLVKTIALDFTFIPITDNLPITGWNLSGGNVILDTDEPNNPETVSNHIKTNVFRDPENWQELVKKYKRKTTHDTQNKKKNPNDLTDKTINKIDCALNPKTGNYNISFKMMYRITDIQMKEFIDRVEKTIIHDENTIIVPFAENFSIDAEIFAEPQCAILADSLTNNHFKFRFADRHIKEVKCRPAKQAIYLEVIFK